MKTNKKAFEIYGSLDEWIDSHKHSAAAVELELNIHMEEIRHYAPDGLKSHISGIEDLRSEIDSEISETKDWMEYFGRR